MRTDSGRPPDSVGREALLLKQRSSATVLADGRLRKELMHWVTYYKLTPYVQVEVSPSCAHDTKKGSTRQAIGNGDEDALPALLSADPL